MLSNRFAAIAIIALSLVALVDASYADNGIYQEVKQSSLWIVLPGGESSGSGALIDEERQLAVTNAHVVKGHSEVGVFAPVHDTNGRLWERSSCLDEFNRLRAHGYATIGRVVAYSEEKDLAILKLQNKLTGVREIEFSDESPQRRDDLHIVGNPASRPLFSYAFGGVRYVGPWDHTFSDGQRINADVIRFSGHVWYGNSGGPVANDEGELVGVVSSKGEATGTAIHVSEVRRLLATIQTHPVFSVANRTNNVVTFRVRDSETGNEQRVVLQPGHYHIWWLDSDASDVDIKFDYSFSRGYQENSYKLTAYNSLVGAGVPPVPAQGKQYYFRAGYRELDLFSDD